MPVYEYKCLKCNKTFTLYLSIKEKSEEAVKCPKCGNTDTQRLYGSFYAVTSKKS